MKQTLQQFPRYACQHCGAERKLVETLIDDEFFWDEKEREYKPSGFSDDFEHTGNEWCAQCKKEWTGE